MNRKGGTSCRSRRSSRRASAPPNSPSGKLKEKLFAKGYFDARRKRPLHPYPRRVAIVTSAKGAAIRDMLELFRQRWPQCEVIVRPCRVQGDGRRRRHRPRPAHAQRTAPDETTAISRHHPGRGGGSSEDLMAFNEEIVADAIFECTVPVISAVGHEIDVTIRGPRGGHRAETLRRPLVN